MGLSVVHRFPGKSAHPLDMRREPRGLIEITAIELVFHIGIVWIRLLGVRSYRLVVKSVSAFHPPIVPIEVMKELLLILVVPRVVGDDAGNGDITGIVIPRTQNLNLGTFVELLRIFQHLKMLIKVVLG